jgi:hypothetical protein
MFSWNSFIVSINAAVRPRTAIILAVVLSAACAADAFAQSPPSTVGEDRWDNLFFVGNKVAYAREAWRTSGEFQVRLKDDMRQLDNWFMEGALTYLASERWEIVPDFRVSVKPSRTEWRPGVAVNFKLQPRRIVLDAVQFVHQVKYQADILSTGGVDHGLRQVVFFNKVAAPRLITNLAAGWFYRWRDGFSGVEFVRFGGGVAFLFNAVHSLGISYFVGTANTGDGWSWSGIPAVNLLINLRTDWKYVPARTTQIG